MADLKMTPARILLLRAVADPKTEVYASVGLGGSWSTADVWLNPPYEVRRKVTQRVDELEVAGLVQRAPAGTRYYQPRHYSLTADGEAILAGLPEGK